MIRVLAVTAMLAVGGFIFAVASLYIVDEGNAAVITHWGEAVGQENPAGLRFKNPITTGVIEFDVRERLLQQDIGAATQNQLPIQATVSVNWRIDGARVMEVYVEYGDPDRFEATVLAARFNQAAKSGISRFQAAALIGDRTAVAVEVLENLRRLVAEYPVVLSSVQIDNVDLPPRYLEAIMAKEEARENASREEYRLQQQKLEAQREVQTAQAEREAVIARAQGQAEATRERAAADAEATRLAGEAEADALRAVNDALASSPTLVDYVRAKRWDGAMPRMMLGKNAPQLLMSLPHE